MHNARTQGVAFVQHVFSRIFEILKEGDVRYSEVQSAFFLLVIGICFMFSHLRIEIRPDVIGIALLVVAAVQFAGIGKGDYAVRRAGVLTSVMLWCFLAAIFADAREEWSLVIAPTFVAFAAAACWGYIRMGQRHDIRMRQERPDRV